MGGAKAGEVASEAAARTFDRDLPEGRPHEEVLRELIQEANQSIHELAREDPDRAGMGTTITAAIINGGEEEVSIGHVGDSRAYRLRGLKFEQLTRDHSLVEEMRRKGQITEAQAHDHPQRSIITRALGPEPHVEVDVQTVPAIAGDIFLLCSDGLTTMLGDDKIAKIMIGAATLDGAVRELINAANNAGGRDNITALAFRVDDVNAPLIPAAGVVAPTGEQPTVITRSGVEEAEPERLRRVAAARSRERAESQKHRRARRVAKTLIVLAVIGLVGFGAWWGNRQVWFLGTDSGGRVSLYRGLPYDLPLGISLYSERYTAPIQTSELGSKDQSQVTDHELRSEDDATSLIARIEDTVRAAEARKRLKQKKQQQKEKGNRKNNQKPAKQPGKQGNTGSAGGSTP